ncbi:leucine-rich repeat domain-containing protein, partial [Listeria ilorinensis]|uniref:leucine-rich repeat domain-containing protein n=1 Tax=Listeria ilorinensis TaxID=2867439 RepID=UPI001EF6BBC3
MKVLIIPFASFGLLFYPVSTNAQTVKSNQSESPQYQNNEESSVHATQTSAVESQTFYDWFPDDHLAEAVAQKLYMEPTDQVSSEDLSQIKVLQCYNAGITDMSGIEYLTGLTFLDCTANQLTELDVSQNVNLEKLNCSKNPLTVLHTGINLKSLDCHSCQFTELNLNQSPNLTELYCYQNQLKELNLSQFVNLEVVDCFNNQLTELNVTNSPHLTELNCESNQLTELDVSQNPKLEYLTVNGNQLTQLDVSENPNLLNLFCIKNQITQLDLTHNPALTIVYAGENQFTNVDVTQCHELRQFECDANQLSSLDVSENPNLTYLYCVDNQLATLDVSQNPELSELYCSSNQLTSIDFGQNPGKYYALYLDDNQLQDFSTMPIDQDTDFVGTGQNIQLAPEETTSNTLTIPVSEELKDENGNPMNITVTDGGIYDPDTNTITWENLDASGTVQYHFASESTRCSGTVTVPYQESKPMTLQVDEEITYDKAAVISEQQFLQDIHATTE